MARRDTRSAPSFLRELDAKGYDTTALSPVGVRPPLGEYLGDLWSRRHFIWMDSRHRVATQHSRNRLGSAWLVLRPLLDALMYFLIFGVVLHITRGVDNFAAYVAIGILMFRATMNSISRGPAILRSSRAMIRAFAFPRATLPISAEIRDSLQMIYTFVVLMVVILVIPPHEYPRWTWLMVVPIYALQFVLNLGISLLLARVGFLLPDVTQVMTFAARFLMYGSGVIFPIEHYFTHPVVKAVIDLNPIYQMLTMYRQVLMDGALPSSHSWAVLAVWAGGTLLVGFVYFWAGEATYGDEH